MALNKVLFDGDRAVCLEYRNTKDPTGSLVTAHARWIVDASGQSSILSRQVGNNCYNDPLSAETMMMVKEHFIETYGEPLFTVGWGTSGGSIQQQLIAQNHPGHSYRAHAQ